MWPLCLTVLLTISAVQSDAIECTPVPDVLNKCMYQIFRKVSPSKWDRRHLEDYEQVYRLWQRNEGEELLARMLTAPSFLADSVIDLYRRSNESTYLSFLVPPSTQRSECEFPAGVGALITAVWDLALGNVADPPAGAEKCPDGAFSVCLDGTTYHFMQDRERRCGNTNNCFLYAGSIRKQLVDIGSKLQEYCQLTPEDRRPALSELETGLARLSTQLEEAVSHE